jgi:hypothetical protein
LASGLPTIAVRDIDIQRRENDLVLATFGRGFYVLDDYSALRQLTPNAVEKEALICDIKDALMFIPRFPLGLRDKGHLGSNYFSTPNPDMGAVITWYLKDDVKNQKDLRKEREKKGVDGKKPVYYPSHDSLRIEDNEKDPYILFTIKDENGNVVRHLKEKAKKGLHRMTWDLRTAPSDPVVGRYTPEPDQLFGSAPKGYLVPPGVYTITSALFQNGSTREIASPVKCTVRLLKEASIPASNISKTLAFCTEVSGASKEMDASLDLLQQLKSRVKNAELAVQDMPATADDILKTLHEIGQSLQPIEIALTGDRSLSGREFETTPSVSDRLSSVMYSVWNTTSDIPATHIQSFEIAVRQLEVWTPKLKEIDARLKAVENILTVKGAPYTPGRW